MNIEAYDLDSLRKIVRTLQRENVALKAQLKKADIAFDVPNLFEVIQRTKHRKKFFEAIMAILDGKWITNNDPCFSSDETVVFVLGNVDNYVLIHSLPPLNVLVENYDIIFV